MPCGGTLIPVSVVSCSGPASVAMSTATSATWLPAFIRYSSIRPAVRWPGPVNQKLVPGLAQAAVGRLPAPVCSASRPCASEPLAWMTTPPLTGVVASALPGCAVGFCCVPVFFLVPVPCLVPVPLPGWPAPLVWVPPACWARAVLRAVTRSTATWASRGTPGWVTLSTRGPAAALPVPVSRVTFSAAPVRAEARPGEVITATPPPGLVLAPGAGQTRCTEVTVATRGDCCTDPAARDMVCRSPASPYTAPSSSTTTAPARIRLPRRLVTTQPPRAHPGPRCPTPRAHPRRPDRPDRVTPGDRGSPRARGNRPVPNSRRCRAYRLAPG